MDGVRTGQMSYDRSRLLLVGAGLVVLLGVAGIMLVRGVDTVEVWAAVLFMPVFVAFMFTGPVVGLVVGLLAGAAYAGLRAPAIDAVGFDSFAGLIFSRTVAYALFGGVGGFANRQLQTSLVKLDLYDEVDDTTGLKNARSFVNDLDLEMARAKRYQTFFSVAVVPVPDAPLADQGRRRRTATLRAMGRMLSEAVRSVDHAVHAFDGSVHRFAVILPETGTEGAGVFGTRLRDNLVRFLGDNGVPLDDPALTVATFPGDDAAMAELRATFVAVDRTEHPETAVADTTPGPSGGPDRRT